MKTRHWLTAVLLLGLGAITSYDIAFADEDNDDADEQEQIVALEDVPDAVQAAMRDAILQELEIEREQEDGQTVYEVEFSSGNKTIELEFAADGTLLEREVEEHDDDDNDDDDDDDDDDHDDDDDDDDD